MNILIHKIKDIILSITDKIWIKRRIILKCKICGSMIAPYFTKISPYDGYGWKRTKDGFFICHNCFYHQDIYSINEKEKMITRINSKVRISYNIFKKNNKDKRIRLIEKSYGYKIAIK